MNNNIYYYGIINLPNFDIIVITVSLLKQQIIETIFKYDDVLNIQDSIENGFGSREIELFMGVNSYFGPIIINRPHATPKYEPGKSKFDNDYYGQKYRFPETNLIYEENEKNVKR